MRKKKGLLATAITTIILLVAFSLLGYVIAPHWVPQDSTATIDLGSTSTAIASNDTTNDTVGTYDVTEATVPVDLDDGTTISAIVRMPVARAGGQRLAASVPGCMLITGAGLGKATEVYGDIAWGMASAGVATIVPDKNMTDYSWQHRDYVKMAHDYEKTLDVLEAWPGVDPEGVGLYAESEGAWITPIIASERNDVSFSIMTSAPVYTPRQQMTYAIDDYFRVLDVPFPTNQITSRITTLEMSGIGPNYADFDVAPYLAKQTQPTLFVYGTNDLSMPTIQAPEHARRIMADNGNTNTLVRYYRGANHQMRVGDAKAKKDLPLADNFIQDMADFAQDAKISETLGWSTPDVAGDDTPWQATDVDTDQLASSVGSGLVGSVRGLLILQGGAIVMQLITLLGLPVLHFLRRRRIRKETALAQLEANSSPDSAATGNIIVKHEMLSREARRRPGFAEGMSGRLWACGLATFLTTLLWLGYVAYTAYSVFKLSTNHTLLVVWQGAARLLVVVCTAAFASLVVHMVRTEIAHRRKPLDERPSVSGAGHIAWTVVYFIGVVFSFIMFMYWGLFLV